MNPVLQNLYDFLKSKNVELPEKVEDFGTQMANDFSIAKNTYDFVKSTGEVDDLPGDVEGFLTGLGIQKKNPFGSSQQVLPATPGYTSSEGGGGYAGGSVEQTLRLENQLGKRVAPFDPAAVAAFKGGVVTPEDEQAVKDFATRPENDNGIPRISSYAGKFDQGIIKTFAAVPKAVAKGMSIVLGQKLDDQILYKVADWAEKQIDPYMATNPAYDDEIGSHLMETAGVITAYMMGGSYGRTSRTADLAIPGAAKAVTETLASHLPTAFMAASGTAMGEYEAALQKGATQDQADEVFYKSLSAGLPFLVTPTINAFNSVTNNSFKYAIREGVKSGITGAFQLGTSQALANLSAQQAYDKTRSIVDGVMEAGGSGFAINAVLSGIIAAVSHHPINSDAKLKIIGYVKSQQKLLSDNNIRDTDYYRRGSEPIKMEEVDGVWRVKGEPKPQEHGQKEEKRLLSEPNPQGEHSVLPGESLAKTTGETAGPKPVFEEGDATARAVVDQGEWPHYNSRGIVFEEGEPSTTVGPPEQIDIVERAESRRAAEQWSKSGFVMGKQAERPLINNTGKTQAFFSDVVTGRADKFRPVNPYRPLLSFTPPQQKFNEIYSKFKGSFDEHIATSIPAFRDVQVKKGQAIVDMLPNGGLMIDIAGSEGGLNKAITVASGGKIKTVNVDVNPDMMAAHKAAPVEGADFAQSSFLQPYTEGNVTYPKYEPSEKADVVHESMGFQFMSPQRTEQIAEAKRYMKPNGVLIVEEKVGTPEWDVNEKKKDEEFKSRYYTKEQIEEKNKAVRVSDFDSNEGMAGNMVTEDILLGQLGKNFRYVSQYWDAGNFKGYIASNDKTRIDSFMKSIGSTNTEFSNRTDAELKTNIKPTVVSEKLVPAKLSSPELLAVEKKYVADNGITTPQTDINKVFKAEDVDAIARMHEEAKDGSQDPRVIESYRAFMKETLDQYNALVAAGYKMEPFLGEGEPYGVDSKLVRKDLNENKHLSYLMSESAIGDSPMTTLKDYILLEDTGIVINGKKVPYNDLFRAVHDVMGHGIYNNSFSTQGEYKAYLTHSNMYSEKAQMALFLETVVYNAYYAKNGQFAPRKLYFIPQSLIDKMRGVPHSETKFKAETSQDLIKGSYYEPGMTTSKPGSYDFFHFTNAPETSISKGIDSRKFHSTRTSREEKGLQYGVASYYTKPTDKERMIGGDKYVVSVPREQVYPMDTDPFGFRKLSEERIPEGTPFREEAIRRDMAKQAADAGFKMAVAEWHYDRSGRGNESGPAFRADALVPLVPRKFSPEETFSPATTQPIPHVDQNKILSKERLDIALGRAVDYLNKKQDYGEAYKLAKDIMAYNGVYENGAVREVRNEDYVMIKSAVPKRIREKIDESLAMKDVVPSTTPGEIMGEVLDRIEAGISRFGGLGVDMIKTNEELMRLAEVLSGKKKFFAEGILTGDVKIPEKVKSGSLVDKAEWLFEWSRKKNKAFKAGLGNMSDEKIISGLVDILHRELSAWGDMYSGTYKGFYDFDIGTVLGSDLSRFAKERYGRDLTRGEEVAYHILSAFASPSANPKFDSQKGLEIFDRMMLGDGVPSAYTSKPKLDEKGNQVIKNGVPQFAQVAPYYASDSLAKYNDLLTKFGGDKEKLTDWLLSRHTYQELAEAAGKPSVGPKAKRLGTHEYLTEEDGGYGIFVVTGPKLGSYILNRVGNMSTVTKDLWWSRWFYRATGEPLTIDGEIASQPPAASTKEGLRIRRIADEAFNRVARELDTTPADIQQKIWDFEQRIYQAMGHSNDPKYASEGFAKGSADIIPGFKSSRDIHYLSDNTGRIYGFTHDGKIYLSAESVNPNVAIHEAGEIWTEWASRERPDLYKAGIEKVDGSEYLKEVESSPFYQEQTRGMSDAEKSDYMKREALNMAIGDEGQRFVDESKRATFKEWLADLWNSIAEMIGIRGMSADAISKMSLKEFAKRVVADILSPNTAKPEDVPAGDRPQVSALDAVRSLDEAPKRYPDSIVPMTISPLAPLQGIVKMINLGQDLTIGRATKALEDWMARMENRALRSTSYSVRAAAQALRNIIGGLPYTQEDLSRKLEFAGGKNTAAVRAKIAFEEWYKIVDKDPNSLARVHAVMDPEAYKNDPVLSRVTASSLNARERALVDQLRLSNDFIHDWVYNHGLISKETYDRYKDRYIARMYEEFELMPDDIKDKLKAGGGADLTFLYRRDNEPSEGILRDPVYATAKRLGQVLQVKAIFEYADAINASKNVRVSDTEFPGSVQLGTPGGRPYYGSLTGKYVPQYIAEDFRGFFFSNHVLQNFYDFAKTMDRLALKQFLKKSKTVYNPLVQLGNFTANFSMAFWSGIDPITFGVNQVRAVSEMKSRGKLYMEALQEGVLGSDIMLQDLASVAPRNMPTGILGSTAGKLVNLESKVAEWVASKAASIPGLPWLRNVYNSITGGATSLYARVDDVAKLAAYISNREAGYSVKDAANRTYEGFQNYLTVGKMYDVASKTPVIGNPYIKFKPDLFRMIKNAVTRRPLNTALYLAMLYMVKEWLSSLSEEDPAVKAVRESRHFIPKVYTPFGSIPMVWQTPWGEVNFSRFMTPYYSYDKGDDTYINHLSEWLPYQVSWGPGTNKDTYSTYVEMPDVLWGTVAQVIFDTDFRGKSIKDPQGSRYHSVAVSGWDQTMNSIHFLMRSQVPFFRSADDLIAAMEGRPDYYNRIRDVKQALLNNVIKVQEFGQPEAQAYIVREIESKADKLTSIEGDIQFLTENYMKELARIETLKMSDASKNRERQLVLDAYLRNSKVKQDQLLNTMKELVDAQRLFEGLENSPGR